MSQQDSSVARPPRRPSQIPLSFRNTRWAREYEANPDWEREYARSSLAPAIMINSGPDLEAPQDRRSGCESPTTTPEQDSNAGSLRDLHAYHQSAFQSRQQGFEAPALERVVTYANRPLPPTPLTRSPSSVREIAGTADSSVKRQPRQTAATATAVRETGRQPQSDSDDFYGTIYIRLQATARITENWSTGAWQERARQRSNNDHR